MYKYIYLYGNIYVHIYWHLKISNYLTLGIPQYFLSISTYILSHKERHPMQHSWAGSTTGANYNALKSGISPLHNTYMLFTHVRIAMLKGDHMATKGGNELKEMSVQRCKNILVQ